MPRLIVPVTEIEVLDHEKYRLGFVDGNDMVWTGKIESAKGGDVYYASPEMYYGYQEARDAGFCE